MGNWAQEPLLLPRRLPCQRVKPQPAYRPPPIPHLPVQTGTHRISFRSPNMWGKVSGKAGAACRVSEGVGSAWASEDGAPEEQGCRHALMMCASPH